MKSSTTILDRLWLGVATAAITLLLGLTATADAADTPAKGAVIPVGTEVTGPCSSESDLEPGRWPEGPPEGATYYVKGTVTEFYARGSAADTWTLEGSVSPDECEAVPALRVGDWRMVVSSVEEHYRWGGGWATTSSTTDTYEVTFTVADADEEPCLDLSSAKITMLGGGTREATEADRRSLGLGGPDAYGVIGGKPITAPSGTRVQIEMPDGTTLRLNGGARMQLVDSSCRGSAPKEEGIAFKIRLLAGKIWSKVAPDGGRSDYEVRTERAINGVRGTVFEVSYDPRRKLTRTRVIEGKVRLARVRRPQRAILLKAGQTGVQKGDAAPRRARR